MLTNNIDNEDELIEQAKTDPEAFGILYQRYVDQLYNFIYYRTNNQQDAEDLTAKVFHKALKHISSYKHKGRPFSAWLNTIARNLVINWYRDKKNTTPIYNSQLKGGKNNDPYHNTLKKERTTLLIDTINNLSVVEQQLLSLKFSQRKSNAEIGRILNGRTEGAIKALYHRTLNKLRKLLADYPELLEPLDTENDH